MRTKRSLVVIALLVLIVLATSTVEAKKPPLTEEIVIWELTKTTVADPGQTTTIPQGTLTTGYQLVADAKSKFKNIIAKGKFELTLNAFSPSRDMPGQSAGVWYLQGEWTITNVKVQTSENKRHRIDQVTGMVKAELPFNPATRVDNWSSLAWLPMSTAVGRWSQGEGSLTMDSKKDGFLLLNLKLWPQQ